MAACRMAFVNSFREKIFYRQTVTSLADAALGAFESKVIEKGAGRRPDQQRNGSD